MNKSDDLITKFVDLQSKISELEWKVRRARAATGVLRFALISAPLLLATLTTLTVVFQHDFDFGPSWILVGIYTAAAVLAVVVLGIWGYIDQELLTPRQLQLDLDRQYQLQALEFSGAQIALPVRQYAFRGAMLRMVENTRRRGDRNRRVNTGFQSAIIVGSLATTTVASLNPDNSIYKWIAVGLSFLVGLAAGFTGYFKYRERAFYLRQTADDIEEQLKAYDLGLPPYDSGTEEQRIAVLTARTEALRIAQQRREQQLDQPKEKSADA